jgi:hypothetical protein
MSLEMTFEADECLTEQDVVRALAGLAVVQSDDQGLSGVFGLSSMRFVGRFGVADQALRTEGMESRWCVGSRMTFQLVVSRYGECMKDLGAFIVRLAHHGRARFVVAFEYENVHAVRDEGGLRLLNPEMLQAKS